MSRAIYMPIIYWIGFEYFISKRLEQMLFQLVNHTNIPLTINMSSRWSKKITNLLPKVSFQMSPCAKFYNYKYYVKSFKMFIIGIHQVNLTIDNIMIYERYFLVLYVWSQMQRHAMLVAQLSKTYGFTRLSVSNWPKNVKIF